MSEDNSAVIASTITHLTEDDDLLINFWTAVWAAIDAAEWSDPTTDDLADLLRAFATEIKINPTNHVKGR